MSISRCRQAGCGQAILWLPHETTGKTAPIDAEPVFGGNIELVVENEDTVGYRIVPKEERDPGRPLHKNHFVTCPNPPRRKK